MSQSQICKYRILSHFSSCKDPRKHRIRHNLIDIIVMVVLATLCGEEGWEGIHDWSSDQIDFLSEFLDLQSGIPCPDTIRRVVERLDPDRFLEPFLSWAQELGARKLGQICIDGKTLRKAMDEKGALHPVSAFVAENGLILGCKDANGKGKEIPTIKEILNTLALKPGDIITIDAIGCQKQIVEQIKKQKGDYLIALKKNQYPLWSEAENFFGQAFECEEYAPIERALRWSCQHGREDTQKIWVTRKLDWLGSAAEWKDLKSLICVQRDWSVKGEKKSEIRYYISSSERTSTELGEIIRRHWSFENEYHWHLDVTFREDDSEISARSNRILRTARTIALQLLKAETSKNISVARKKRRCHRSIEFLRQVLVAGNF